jgi:hypothetical protein
MAAIVARAGVDVLGWGRPTRTSGMLKKPRTPPRPGREKSDGGTPHRPLAAVIPHSPDSVLNFGAAFAIQI